MSFNKPPDRVLSWVLPLLPAAIAFVLLCLLLVSSERMLADEFRQRANAHVEQASRLFVTLLARSTAARAMPPEAARAETRTATGRDPMRLDTTAAEDLRQHLLGPVEARQQLDLAVVDAEGRARIGAIPPIDHDQWGALLTGPEGTPRTVTDETGRAYVVSRLPITAGEPPLRTAWQAVVFQPLDAALASLYPFRRNLLAWAGGITLLLGLAGFALSHYLARHQREHRQHLREQGKMLSAAINSAGDAIVSVDPAGRITQFNPAAARIFGYPANKMLGQPLHALLPQVPHLDCLQRGAPSTGPMGVGRIAGVRADGQALELEASVSQITLRGARTVTAILRDVTERVRTERALAQQQLALSELTRRLLQQDKQTTRRLAQTLHDQLGQTVGAMRLSFDVLLNLIPEPIAPKLRDRGRVLGQLIDTATAQVRQALVALRPPLLDEEGLLAALQHEVHARAADAEPVVLQLEVAPSVARLRWPADVEHAAFMVAREAMANALLHASARTVVLRVEGYTDQLHLSVTDDGVGLNPDMAAGRPGHLGIVGMRERALAIDAHLHAHSLIEGGTIVSLTWEASAQNAPLHKLSNARH